MGNIYSKSNPQLCIDLNNADVNSGNVTILTCNSAGNQNWGYDKKTSYITSLINQTYCLHVDGEISEAANINLSLCAPKDQFLWNVYADGTVRPSSDTSLCLNASTLTAGNPLKLTSCTNNSEQQWGGSIFRGAPAAPLLTPTSKVIQNEAPTARSIKKNILSGIDTKNIIMGIWSIIFLFILFLFSIYLIFTL